MARSQELALCRTIVLAAAVLATLLQPSPVRAQTDDPPIEFPSLDAPWGDLSPADDPDLRFYDPELVLPLDPYDGSIVFLDPESSDDVDATPAGGDPSYMTPSGVLSAPAPWVPLNCADYTNVNLSSKIKPISLAATNPRYFSFNGVPLILLGASADAGCVLNLAETNQCSYATYASVFQKSDNLTGSDGYPISLNKVRVWVGMGYGYSAPNRQTNVPFSWQSGGYWFLDSKDSTFIERLRTVVNEARKHHMFVEVTLLIPFEGKDFNLGPWTKTNSRAADPAGSTNIVPMGFSSAYYQVLNDTVSPDQVMNEKMRAYQANIIKWTVDTLWCFDNVYWEIANEPEGLGPDNRAVAPAAVEAWQKSMIVEVHRAERNYSSKLAFGHLIAVQPFSIAGTLELFKGVTAPTGWVPDPNFPLDFQVLNGHYTSVSASPAEFPSGGHPLDSGAMDIIRNTQLNGKHIPYGFNETTITNISGLRGTRAHLNGAPASGRPEGARAEAWEFLFAGGTSYDHYGYLGTYDSAIRQQLGYLMSLFWKRKFDLMPAPSLTQIGKAAPTWFSVSSGGYGNGTWDPRTKSQRYWAALGVGNARLVYIHHSTPRCKGGNPPADVDFVPGCPGAINDPFGSYDARIWTRAPVDANGHPLPPAGYQDAFTFQAGTYLFTWIDPETTLPMAGGAETTLSCASPCTVTSPVYKFDILWKVVRQ